jgi:hypothetical protein
VRAKAESAVRSVPVIKCDCSGGGGHRSRSPAPEVSEFSTESSQGSQKGGRRAGCAALRSQCEPCTHPVWLSEIAPDANPGRLNVENLVENLVAGAWIPILRAGRKLVPHVVFAFARYSRLRVGPTTMALEPELWIIAKPCSFRAGEWRRLLRELWS